MKFLTVVGARPQFIKAAAFSCTLKDYSEINEVIVHTGQHYDKNMSKVFFEELSIPKPKYILNSGGMSHGGMTGYLLTEIEKIILQENPDYVIVYGDTNSTLAGSLAAVKLHIPIAHIESGLRSFNTRMPEEINRILTDRISSFLFCPTKIAVENLYNEGFNAFQSNIYEVGDIMYDSIKLFSSMINPNLDFASPYALCTIHRQENTNDINRFTAIINGLNDISNEIKIKLPLHPRTKNYLKSLNLQLNENIEILEPQSYIGFISLMQHSKLIISDSGGIQKEAYFLKKNCIVLRDETEWTELIDSKNNILVGANKSKLIKAYQERAKLNQNFSDSLYGDGKTARKIIDILVNSYRDKKKLA